MRIVVSHNGLTVLKSVSKYHAAAPLQCPGPLAWLGSTAHDWNAMGNNQSVNGAVKVAG